MEKKKLSKLDLLKKIVSIVFKILYDILIFFCVILIVVVVWQRITDSNKSIYGYRLFRIISGSMVPEYNIDEVVICKEIDTNTLKIGDIVVYRGRIGELNNKLVMHEIVDIRNQDNQLTFDVKGIQNDIGDPNVSPDQILGKVIFKSEILTYLYSLATSTYWSFIIIMILVINVFIAFKPTRKEPQKLTEHCEDDKKIEEKKDVENKVKRYKLKDYENSIKIIKKNNISEEKKEETPSKQIDENEKLQEENRKLQEENKILKEKVKKYNKENKKENDRKEKN